MRELNPSQRSNAIRELLADPSHRPAIVYASTRKHAERYAEELGMDLQGVRATLADAAADEKEEQIVKEGEAGTDGAGGNEAAAEAEETKVED